MRILQVNKYNYLRGGAETYYLELSELLEKAGHEVANFCMQHPKNLPSRWSKYFVSRISFNEPRLRDYLIAPLRILYSFEAKRKFARLLKDFKPDVIHAHNIYNQISPAILDVAAKHTIPVVMHLHDYSLVSPDHQLFLRGKIYERCLGGNYYRCVIDRCHKGSYSKSLLAAAAMYLHHKIWRIYERKVDRFIAPSRFMKDTCVRAGFPERQIEVLCYFVSAAFAVPATAGTGDYLLYAGRLSEEKGIPVLLKALAAAEGTMKLKIAGSGPEEAKLRALAEELGLSQRVEFLGYQPSVKIFELMDGAKAAVIPAIWYDNMPLSMLETLARKRIVIASRIGGFPERIEDGKNGYLFEAGNERELARKLDTVAALDASELETMSQHAFASVKELKGPEHLASIMKIYEDCIAKHTA